MNLCSAVLAVGNATARFLNRVFNPAAISKPRSISLVPAIKPKWVNVANTSAAGIFSSARRWDSWDREFKANSRSVRNLSEYY